MFTYVVQPGDTLFSIASRFGVTVDAILQANNLQGGYLYAGQSLRIPSGGVGASGAGFPFPLPIPGGQGRLEQRVDRLEREVNQLQRQITRLDNEMERLERRVRRLEER